EAHHLEILLQRQSSALVEDPAPAPHEARRDFARAAEEPVWAAEADQVAAAVPPGPGRFQEIEQRELLTGLLLEETREQPRAGVPVSIGDEVDAVGARELGQQIPE